MIIPFELNDFCLPSGIHRLHGYMKAFPINPEWDIHFTATREHSDSQPKFLLKKDLEILPETDSETGIFSYFCAKDIFLLLNQVLKTLMRKTIYVKAT